MKKLYNLILLSLVCFGLKAQIVSIDQNGGTSGNIVVGQSNYHVSESIFLDSEIGSGVFTTAGNGITKIGFSLNSNTVATLPLTINNFKVSMKSVAAATTTLATGANNTTGYTVVFNGSITFSGLGWNTILLSTPFVRTAGQNLQIKIERSDNLAGSGLTFDPSVGNYSNTAATSSRRYNGTAAITTATSLTATAFRPAIQLIRPFPVDAEVIGFLNPYSSCYDAPQTVKVGIKNNGTSPIAAGAASVSLEVATANTFLGTVTNSAIIPSDSIAILTFTGVNMPVVGTNDETAVVTVAGDGYSANDSGFSAVTTTPVLSPLPQVEDVEGAFNVFAYLKSVAGSNAWTVLSFISNTGAWQNGWNQNDSLVPRANGGGSDYFIFDSWDQPEGTVSRLYSNCISMPASGTSRVSFWMSHDSAFATNLDSLYVIVSSDKGATWTRVGGFQRPNDALLEYTWQQDSVDISAYNGQTIQVGFEGVSYYGNAIGLDDINIYNIVSCSTFVTPTFNQVAAVCAGSTITLPTTSTNGVTGTWTPAINNQNTTTYTFVPNGGQCVTTTPVTMTVTVNPATVPSFTQVAAICKGGSFTLPTTSNNSISGNWSPAVNNQTTTTYTFTPNAGVCATTTTMTVTVKQPSFSTTSFSNCVNYTWNGQTYTASGTYTKTGLTNSVGCDSIAFLNLTIKQPTTSNTSASVCVSSLPYSWNGLSLSAAGSYTKVFANGNAVGCDSTAVLALTVNTTPVTPTFTQVAAICAGGSFTLPASSTNGITGSWTPAINNQATTTYDFVPNGGQCVTSTTVTMTVSVKQPTFSTTSFSNCVNYTWNGQTYTASGTYTKVFANGNAAGCDSTAYLNLTIKQTTTSNTSANVCATSLPYIWNGISCASAGTYTKVFAGGNAVGCDSTAYLTLTVNTTPTTPNFTQVAAICAGGSFTLPSTSTNGVSGIWSPAIDNQNTTTYTFTPDAGQCVTTTPVTMTVTVTPVTTTPTSQTACSSYTWPSNGTTYTSSGSYTKVTGCATEILNLTINQPSSSVSSANVCATSLPYVWNGTSYNASGSFTKVFAAGNSVGCDSTAILNLTVNTSPVTPSFTQVAAICAGGTFTLPSTSNNGVSGSWTPSIDNQNTTTYTFTPDAGQCVTGSVTMTVTVNPVNNTSETQAACGSYTWNGTTYTASGVYTNNNGCSTATLNLTITQPTTNATTVKVCSTSGISYTWAANNQSYNAAGTYTYLDNVNCINNVLNLTDTCFSTETVVYPTPTSGKVKVNWSNANFQVGSKVIVSVYDRAGKLVSKTSPIVISGNGQEVDLGLSAYSNGMYFIKIETTIGQSARYSTKIIKSSN